jgi:hypothetical protein
VSRIGSPAVRKLDTHETVTFSKVGGNRLQESSFAITSSWSLQQYHPPLSLRAFMKVSLEKISSGLIDRNNKILGVPSEYLETAAKRVRNTHRHGSETIAP